MKAHSGTIYGIPYAWRWPTWAGIMERVWNPLDRRIFTPPALMFGWSINLYEVLRRVGLLHAGDR